MAWETRFSLAGRTALITGASSGIGAAIAEVFADAGADIAGHGRDATRLGDIGKRVTAKGRSFTAITGDLADPLATENVALQALNAFGQIDILVMEQKRGKIINISSQTGVIALKDHVAYATSKGGLNALTKSLMTEAAPHNVQVNAICPTVVLTEMGKELWSAPEKRDPMIAKTPLGRFGEPTEIADMALYLASPASDLVNGGVMMIEGGYSSI